MKTRVIIGAGTAAAVFLKTMPTDGWKTVVVGADGLWAQLPDKPMGQPAHLLQLPGEKVPAFQTASGGTEEGLEKFLSAKSYQEGVAKIVAGHRYVHKPERRVKRISKSLVKPNKLAIWFDEGVLRADEVIVATGIGPQLKPPTIEGLPKTVDGYTQVIEGIDFLSNKSEQTPKIDRFVYGGGATAAWVAALAYQNSPRMGWFARPGGREFTGSDLPGIRNEIILSKTENEGLRSLEDVEKVVVADNLLKIYVKGKDYYYIAHQFIYALGGDKGIGAEGGIHQMIDKDLRDELSPFLDKNGALATIAPPKSSVKGEKHDDFDPVKSGTLAWSTPSGSLKIVGAAAFNVDNLGGSKTQSAPMATLPWNARVPDGIAVIVATVSALNSFIPVKQSVKLGKTKNDWADVKITENTTNINLADNNQLAVLFTLMFDDWSAPQVNQLVRNVVEARSRTDKTANKIDTKSSQVFGISPKTFHELVDKIRKTSEQSLLERFQLIGVDFK